MDDSDNTNKLDIDLSVKVRKRGYLRTKITKLHNKTLDEYESWSKQDINLNLQKAKNFYKEVTVLDNEISDLSITLDVDEEQYDSYCGKNDEYSDSLLQIIVLLEDLNSVSTSNAINSNTSVGGNGTKPQSLKLPTVELPQYSNASCEKLENFSKFWTLFLPNNQIILNIRNF